MSVQFGVYVAAPFADAAFVREHVHERLRAIGCTPTSSWVDTAAGPENFARYLPAELRRNAEHNDRNLRGSDVVLVVAREGAGGETFAEARIAIEWGKPVVWCGRRILSAWRAGVVRVDDLDGAMATLAAMRGYHAEGLRGRLLATMAERAGV